MPVLLIVGLIAAAGVGYAWWRKENPTPGDVLDEVTGRGGRRFIPAALGTGAESDGNACGCHPHSRNGGRRR